MESVIRRLRWRMHSRRCLCGKHRIAPGSGLELAGFRHAQDGCYRCDEYGMAR